ncbi:MAG: glucokinase, partial [Edwardsiella sp. (in: enterobacteria)]
REYEHVSAERLISGDGLELIYRALADRAGVPAEALPAAEITRRALAGDPPVIALHLIRGGEGMYLLLR